MQQKSFPFWFFGLFGLAFIVFVAFLAFTVPIDESVWPLIIAGTVLYAIAAFFLIRKALRIDRNKRLALNEGVSLEAEVVQHRRSFNMFSSTRYYVIEFTFTCNGKTYHGKSKYSDSKSFEKHPLGSKISILFHEASDSVYIGHR